MVGDDVNDGRRAHLASLHIGVAVETANAGLCTLTDGSRNGPCTLQL